MSRTKQQITEKIISSSEDDAVVKRMDSFNVPRCTENDVVNDFRIDITQSVLDLSNEFAKYYIAQSMEPDENGEHRRAYAIVFERSFCPNYNMIRYLAYNGTNAFIRPISYALAKLSNDNMIRFVVLVPYYDYKSTLHEFIKKHGPSNAKLIHAKFTNFFVDIIKFCDAYTLCCGNINPHNIIIDGDNVFLREPFVSLPHYFQETAYLGTELLDALPYARQTYGPSADMYAIGIVCIELNIGTQPWLVHKEKLKDARLRMGSLQATLSSARVYDDIKTLVKGCVQDNVLERWKLRNLQDWANGKTARSLIMTDNLDGFAPISFSGQNFNNFLSLASSMFANWESATHFIHEERLFKWVQRSVGKNKVAEAVYDVLSQESGVSSTDKDDKLFKVIAALDIFGPIRTPEISVSLFALPQAILFTTMTQQRAVLDGIMKVLLKRIWTQIEGYGKQLEQDIDYFNMLNDVAAGYNSQMMGFGIERVIYMTNPTMPCLSPLVYNEYFVELPELMSFLNNLAGVSPEKFVLDKHIISFITCKAGITRDMYTNKVKDFMNMSENTALLYGLAAIVLACSKVPGINLSNISKLFAQRVALSLNTMLHNSALKKSVLEKIGDYAGNSNLPEILNLISNPKMYYNDNNGYSKACAEVADLNKKISALTYTDRTVRFGQMLGQRIVVLMSYLLFLIVTMSMLM